MSDTTLYPRFIHAKFGEIFKTRDGGRAIYIGKTDPFLNDEDVMTTHLFYVDHVGINLYYNDGASVNGLASDDIVGRDTEVDESSEYFIQGWQLAKLDDCMKKCRRYISAVYRRNKRDDRRINELLEMIDRTRQFIKL